MEFNIGDKVIAIRNHTSGIGHVINKDQEYIVKGITSCPCGIISLNVGIAEGLFLTECTCGLTHSLPIWWVKAMRFTKANNTVSVDVTAFMDIFSKQTIETND